MKNYYRIMLGARSAHAAECFQRSFIGADFGIDQDLTNKLTEEWRDFYREFIPAFLANHPDKSKVAAGLACGSLWTIGKGIHEGDTVLSPNGAGGYRVGEVVGSYFYRAGEILPHRRRVTWLSPTIERSEMSKALRYSTGAIGTLSNITRHQDELERLLHGLTVPTIIATDRNGRGSVGTKRRWQRPSRTTFEN